MKHVDWEYIGLKSIYRRRVQDTLNDIRCGVVQEQDLDKLHNFCMVSLMLLNKVNKATWRSAERMAETMDLLQEGQIVKAENRHGNEDTQQQQQQHSPVYQAPDFGDGDEDEEEHSNSCRGDATVLEDPRTVE